MCTWHMPRLCDHGAGGAPVSGTHDGGVAAVEVLHVLRERVDVALARDDDAAGHRRADELVPAHAHAADWLAEGHHGRALYKRNLQHSAT